MESRVAAWKGAVPAVAVAAAVAVAPGQAGYCTTPAQNFSNANNHSTNQSINLAVRNCHPALQGTTRHPIILINEFLISPTLPAGK